MRTKLLILLLLSGITSVAQENASEIDGSVIIDGIEYDTAYWPNAKVKRINKSGHVDIPSQITVAFGDEIETLCVSQIGGDVIGFYGDEPVAGENLKSISLPNTISVIGGGAFKNCKNLERVDITSDYLDILGNEAFMNCTSLKSIFIPKLGNDEYHYHMESRFSGCTNLSEVVLSEGVTSIGSYDFYNCPNLKYITIPESITFIAPYAFDSGIGINITNVKNWLNIDKLIISNGVIPIGFVYDLYLDGSFANTLRIPNNVDVIPEYALAGCRNLEKIIIPNSVKEIQSGAFSGEIGSANLKSVILEDGDDEITISNEITSHFPYNKSHDIYIGRKIKNHTDFVSAFKVITIGEKISEIPDSMFLDGAYPETEDIAYKRLVVNLPSTLKDIGNHAFNGPIENLNVLSVTPPTLQVDDKASFFDYNSILSVPAIAETKYRSALGWKNFFQNKTRLLIETEKTVVSYKKGHHNENYDCNSRLGGSSVMFIPINDSITIYFDIPDGEELYKIYCNNVDITSKLNNYGNKFYYTVTGYSDTNLRVILKSEISGIVNNPENHIPKVIGYYDIHGCLLSAPVKGINIVKYSDGTTRKELVR